MGSSSSGGNSGSSRGGSANTTRTVWRPNPHTASGMSRGTVIQSGRTRNTPRPDRDRNDNRGGGGGNNNQPTPTPTPTPEPTPIVEEGGKIIDPNFYLLQKEQRRRRLGRNYFSLLGVTESFTGVKRNLLF